MCSGVDDAPLNGRRKNGRMRKRKSEYVEGILPKAVIIREHPDVLFISRKNWLIGDIIFLILTKNMRFMKNEVVDSIEEATKEKLSTSFYGLYVIFWSIFHWKFLVALFFVSEEKIYEMNRMLKVDYLYTLLWGDDAWWYILFWLLPIAISYSVIRWLNRFLLLPLYRYEADYKMEKRRIQIKNQIRLSEERKKLEETKVQELEISERRVKKKKAIEREDPTLLWEEDYREFESTNFYHQFNLIVESLFKYRGAISKFGRQGKLIYEIPADLLAFCDSNELISFVSHDEIQLEPKGKFFVKKFSMRNKLRILEAKYGRGNVFADITKELNNRIKNGRLQVTITNQIVGDPLKGTEKEAVILYEYDGDIGKMTVPEGQTIILPEDLPTGPEDFADYEETA